MKTLFIWIQLNSFTYSYLVTSITFAYRIGNVYTAKILSFIRSRRPEVYRCWGVLAWVFSCEFCEISNNTFSYRAPPVADSALWRSSFWFSSWRCCSFLTFMKTWTNLTKATLPEAWSWHSRSKIRKITGKSGLKFWKLIFFRVIKQSVYRFSKL